MLRIGGLFDDLLQLVAVVVVAVALLLLASAEAKKALSLLTKELREVAPFEAEDTPSYRTVSDISRAYRG